jgi:hypothetical protein
MDASSAHCPVPAIYRGRGSLGPSARGWAAREGGKCQEGEIEVVCYGRKFAAIIVKAHQLNCCKMEKIRTVNDASHFSRVRGQTIPLPLFKDNLIANKH